MIKQFILTIGLNDKDTKTQLVSKEDAIATIFEVVGDATITDAYGCYTHDDGTRVLEKSLRVEMLFKEEHEVDKFIQILKNRLNQESIVKEIKEVNSVLM